MQKTQALRLACSRFFLQSVKMCFSHNEAASIPSNVVLTGICKEKLFEQTPANIPAQNIDDCENVIRSCNNSIPIHKLPLKSWADDLSCLKPKFDSVACLNPRLFDIRPQMDILYQVVEWQKRYREVDYAWTRTRAEIGKGKKKPWPQKGTGMKRQGSRNSPLWRGGGIAHGPRGPKSLFYTLSDDVLVKGLTSALSIKYLQNDLIIASQMDFTNQEGFFEEMLVNRDIDTNSLLFVHNNNSPPLALSEAVENSKTHSVMPLSALNVYSILKHDKLILSVDVLDELEDKLVWQLERYDWHVKPHNFYKDMPGRKYTVKESLVGS